ncbi:MFS transporter [Streptomyces mobaraensis]|uniref:MFS transporter n=1 Tax=Streptomyces mobaraensis TaxID=35621 RepID=UPI0033FC3D08
MPDDIGRRRRVLVLLICCTSLLLVSLDGSAVNIALPALSTELHASMAGLQWIVDSYLLVLASLLMLAGSTADRIGRRRTFTAGLVVFTTGSLLCGFAPGLGWLVAFRVVQAIGGSMLNPVAMAIITNTFTDRAERARAIGVWGGVLGISMALGPVVGGALVDSVGWRAIFWINVPIGIAAVVLCRRFVPESKAARVRRFDPVGQLLVVVLLASLVYAVITGRERGWASAPIVALFALAAVVLVVLVGYERRRAEPLIEPRYFRSVPFSGASVIGFCGVGALGGFLFVEPLYLQGVRGLSAVDAGLYTLPLAAMMLVAGPVSGRLVAARGPRLPLVVAGTAITLAALGLTRVGADTPTAWLLADHALFGLGFGLMNPPITTTAVTGMPAERAGTAAGMMSTARQVGQASGVAVIGTVVSAHLDGPVRTHFAPASHGGWWIVTACGLVVAVLGAATTGPRARRTAVAAAAALTGEPAPERAGAGPVAGEAAGAGGGPGSGPAHAAGGGPAQAPESGPAQASGNGPAQASGSGSDQEQERLMKSAISPSDAVPE